MKIIVLSLSGVVILAMGSFAMAQTGAGEMTDHKGHGYGLAGGYMTGWIVYGLIKAAVVVIGLWLLQRIAKAVEKIAVSKE